MAEHAVETEAAEAKGKKRSLFKILLLVGNLLLFVSGTGFFLLTKFGILHKPAAVQSAETHTEGADGHEDAAKAAHGEEKSAAKKDAAHGKEAKGGGHGKEAKGGGHGKEAKGGGHGKKGEEAEGGPLTIPMQPFVVNLSDGRRYLRLVLQLEVEDEEAKGEVERSMAQMRDRLIFLLSSKGVEEISSPQGKYQLQAEIGKSLNESFKYPRVERVYFTEFIVQ